VYSDLTALGATIFFCARVAHAVLYITGIWRLRWIGFFAGAAERIAQGYSGGVQARAVAGRPFVREMSAEAVSQLLLKPARPRPATPISR
jgi:hypothetical protein